MAAGNLDSTFGSGGEIVIAPGNLLSGGVQLLDTIVQTDGKTITIGTGFSFTVGGYFTQLKRYNTDGTIDTSFGTGGKIDASAGYFGGKQQSDGKIIVLSRASATDITSNIVLTRYNSNGTLDSSFGTDGKLTTDVAGYAFYEERDGKILLGAGGATTTTSNITKVNLYNSDGSLDNTFGTNGKLSILGSGGTGGGIVQTDGKLLLNVAGGIKRYNRDGSPDNTFGYDGVLLASGNLSQQSDGRILVNDGLKVKRYNLEGSRDYTFGTEATFNSLGKTILEGDGKIVTAGSKSGIAGNQQDFFLSRYNNNGIIDSTFGTSGTASVDFAKGSDVLSNLAFGTDGKIFASGQTTPTGASSPSFASASLLNDLSATTNHAPVVANKLTSKVIVNGTAFSLNIPSNTFSDSDAGDSLSYTAIAKSLNANNTFASAALPFNATTGTFSFTPGAYVGPVDIQVTATDKGGLSAISDFKLTVASSNATAANLDPTFGIDGSYSVSVDRFGGLINTTGAIVQADGKVVVNRADGATGIKLTRYNTDGSRDLTFKNSTIANALNNGFSGMIQQSDGKILVRGLKGDINSLSDYNNYALSRFNSDGSVDTTFGTNGSIVTNLNVQSYGGTFSESNGKIFISGGVKQSGSLQSPLQLNRYNSDGSVDNIFGTNGAVILDNTATSNKFVTAIQQQADGKALVGVNIGGSNGADYLFRYNSNGSIDNAFGTNGRVTIVLASGVQPNQILQQSDGKILVTQGTNLKRYNLDGSIDTTFATSGVISFSGSTINNTPSRFIRKVMQASDGKLILDISGSTTDPNRLLRYNLDGTIDNTFTGDFVGDTVFNITQESDGKIVAVGKAPDTSLLGGSYIENFVATRYASSTVTPVPDNRPTITINSTSIAEGNTGSSNSAFSIALSKPSTETVTVNYSTVDGTATADSDYTAKSGTVTFTPGQTSQTINVSVIGDLNSEADETFSVNLTAPTNATLGTAATGTGTIVNDDLPTISVTVTDANAAETATGQPANPGEFTFTRTGVITSAKTVLFSMSGKATNGSDYNLPGSVTFAAGSSTATLSLNAIDDNIFEGATPETAILTLIGDGYYDGSYYSTHQYDRPDTYRIDSLNNTGTISISDNDSRPTVTITDATSVTEGASGAVSNSVFTVALSNPSTETVTVDYKTTDGSATVVDNDYTSTTGTLTFLPGQNITQVINVPVKGDFLVEGDEIFTVDLSNAKNATGITRSTATGKILNDDTYPTISISDAPVITEGNTGTKNAAFTVKLDHASGETVTVQISTKDATATIANNDYQAITNQVVTFAPGQTSQVVNVAVNGDTEYEYNEVFEAVLSSPTKGLIAQGTGVGTINNDDVPTITVVVNKPDAAETLGIERYKRGQFTLTRSGPNDSELTNIKYTLSGTATNGKDYSATSLGGFAAGSSTMVVDLDIIDDNIFEGATPETAILTVVSNGYSVPTSFGSGGNALSYATYPATYAIGATSTATVNITDNDSRPTISIADVSKVEGNSGVTTEAFTVTLSNPSTEAVTVDYTTADGTATVVGNDYTPINGTVTFAPGIISQVVNVPINGDTSVEGDETFAVNLTNAKNATSITRATATGTILNDDNGINVSVANPNAAEGGANGVYTLTRTGSLTNALAVTYTLGGTATTVSDYKPVTGTVTFAAGAATTSVNLTVIDDNLFEGATPESVILTVTPSSNYAIGVNTGTINITDNDLRPTISIADASKTEGDAGTSNAAFTATLSNPSIETVTVDYTTADGTATIAGNDYTPATGTVTFTPGQISQVVNVPVIGDVKIEGNETFAVNLTNAKNATSIDRSSATGTILDDDNGINVSVAEPNLVEGGANGVYTLTRTGVITSALTVAYTLTGTTTMGSDYQPVSGTATFAAGAATALVNLTVIDDKIFEGDTPETAILTLTPSSDYLIGNSNIGTINIADNDPRPTISINNVAIAEGNIGTSNAGFTVSLSNASTEIITVDLSTQDGTATAGSDYQALTNQLFTFAPGETTKTVNIAVNGDTVTEANETFNVILATPTNASLGAAVTGTGTINNDDLPTITVAATIAAASETPTNPGQFTLTRSGPITNSLTDIKYTVTGTATNGTDYTVTGVAAFAAGSSTMVVDLNVKDDNLFEGDIPETAILTVVTNAYQVATVLADGGNALAYAKFPATYAVGDTNTATVNIADNDSRPTISIADISKAEGNTGTSNAAFTVTLSNPSTEAVTVDYTTADGTATVAGNDYTTATGTVTFAPGQTSQVLNIPIVGDLNVENDETFAVNLSNAKNATSITRATATGTILNDDNGINVSVTDPNAAEGGANGVYTLTRTGDLTNAIDVAYTLSGTAASTDYQPVAGTATFAAGAATTSVNLTVIDDTIFEGATPETAILTLTPSTNYLLGNSTTGTINIADNDSRPVISINSTAIAEGNTGTSNAAFTVSLSNASTEVVTVNLSTADGTATTGNNDYQAVTNQLVTFAPGQTSQVVNVAVNGDTAFEANETFSAGLSNATNGSVSSTAGTGTGTINNDDLPTIGVAVTDADAAETLAGQPANPGEFTFTRSGITTDPKTVLYTLSGTATSGDYTIPGSVTFAAGSNTAIVSLSAIDDNIFEGKTPETAILTLRDDRIISFDGILGNDRPATYLIDAVSNAGTLNITDNDLRPTVSIGNVTQAEGNSGTSNFAFNVSLSSPTVETVTVDYSTADGTATVVGTTNLDPDYTAKSGTVTFIPEQTSQTINIAVNSDRDFEPDKTFAVNLTNAQNTNGITTATGTGTITNDDSLPSVTVNATNPISTEGKGEGLFTFYRTGGNVDRALTIDFDEIGRAHV